MKTFVQKKVAIYARVSKIDQNPENQIVELKDFAEREKLEVVRVYEDKISGIKDSRPQLDIMLQDARKRQFNHVIFWKVSRLGRNAIHSLQIVKEWDSLGITFTVLTLGIDTSTPSGRFIFGIMAQYAEFEREVIIENTNLALSRIKKEIATKGKHHAKSGRIITKLGRPKGSKDSEARNKRGYFLRDYKKRTPPPVKRRNSITRKKIYK